MGQDAKINPSSREYTGPNEVLDCRGRPLQEGDEIIVVLHGPTYMRVAKITPNLDPRAEPGAMSITVGASYGFTAMRGVRNPEFIRVQTVQEAGPLRSDAPPKEPPAGILRLAGDATREKES